MFGLRHSGSSCTYDRNGDGRGGITPAKHLPIFLHTPLPSFLFPSTAVLRGCKAGGVGASDDGGTIITFYPPPPFPPSSSSLPSLPPSTAVLRGSEAGGVGACHDGGDQSASGVPGHHRGQHQQVGGRADLF